MKLRTFAITTAVAGLLISAAPAQAQIFGDWGRNTHRVDARRIAYDNGRQKGLEKGEKAVRDRKAFDLEREKDYRNADWGYRHEYGNKDRYREDFRRGFAEGYHQSYARYDSYGYGDRRNGTWYPQQAPQYPQQYPQQYPSYPNDGRVWGGVRNGGYGSDAAYRNGVNDGYQKGRDDARDGKYPQAERQKWYREGDHNYDNDFGMSRDQYKMEYRRGFQEGYNRAYQERGRW
jgi:hypothetical protein